MEHIKQFVIEEDRGFERRVNDFLIGAIYPNRWPIHAQIVLDVVYKRLSVHLQELGDSELVHEIQTQLDSAYNIYLDRINERQET